MSEEIKKCVVCGSTDFIPTLQGAFNTVCKKHAVWAYFFHIDISKERAGITHKTKHYCDICDAKLSVDEVDSIDVQRDFHKTCLKHRPFANFFQNYAKYYYQIGMLPATADEFQKLVMTDKYESIKHLL